MDANDFSLLTLPPPFNMVVLIVLLVVVGGLIERLIKAVRGYADNRAHERFKLEMIQSGLTIEEAERWAALPVDSPASAAARSSEQPAEEVDDASVLV